MTQRSYELSSVCRDALVSLAGATRIEYRDGSAWAAEDDEREHPLVPALRAASLQSLVEEPPMMDDGSLVGHLNQERNANDAMRRFLLQLQQLCEDAGAPRDAQGPVLIGWLAERLRH